MRVTSRDRPRKAGSRDGGILLIRRIQNSVDRTRELLENMLFTTFSILYVDTENFVEAPADIKF
jgi:hypothetical protein